jgi:hypothetical protein
MSTDAKHALIQELCQKKRVTLLSEVLDKTDSGASIAMERAHRVGRILTGRLGSILQYCSG